MAWVADRAEQVSVAMRSGLSAAAARHIAPSIVGQHEKMASILVLRRQQAAEGAAGPVRRRHIDRKPRTFLTGLPSASEFRSGTSCCRRG